MKSSATLRMKLFGLLIVALLCGGCAQVQAASEHPPLTIMAYNLENMFDVFDDPYTSDQDTRVKPREEIQAVANLIKTVKPDIVAVEEVENEGVLRAMVQEFLPDEGYHFITVIPGNSGRGINVGVISKRRIASITSHRFRELSLPEVDRHWRFARDLLRVTFDLGEDQVLDLYVVHLKSRIDSSDDPNSAHWRLAEATEARRIIDEQRRLHPDHMVLMTGDFNDTPDAPGIKLLTTQTIDGMSPLIDLHRDLPTEDRITYLHEPYRSTIDYMLGNDVLAKRVVKGSAKVINDETLTSGSDHGPVVVKINLDK